MKRVLNWKTAIALLIGLNAGALMIHEARAGQPRMEEALTALQTAKGHLEAAEADKGGHRAKAIEMVNAAIAETRAGMEFGRGR